MSAGLSTIAIALINTVIPIIDRRWESKPENEVKVPHICKKGFPVDLEQATLMLTGAGLVAIPTEVRSADAHPRYKDCKDMQVVDSDPKPDSKVKSGSSVVVKYVTQDVIDASKLIFSKQSKRKKLKLLRK